MLNSLFINIKQTKYFNIIHNYVLVNCGDKTHIFCIVVFKAEFKAKEFVSIYDCPDTSPLHHQQLKASPKNVVKPMKCSINDKLIR